ncbi:hypothetical protein [Solicola gregarius]|uniref:Uncharacterized protein n=1 Tax=Solicola gregarius TaxID=2908642 RepID=A0AA46TLY2_9ACTN|nr:hypothetical protein [Solicola gregarius]UYM07690.1 hypothetical protein L0C25_11655 [Solicola gregarius]
MFPSWAFAILVGIALGLTYVIVTTRRSSRQEPNASGNVIERVERRRRRPASRLEPHTEEAMLEVHRMVDEGRKAEAVTLLQRTSELSLTDATARVDTWSLMSARRAEDMAETDY